MITEKERLLHWFYYDSGLLVSHSLYCRLLEIHKKILKEQNKLKNKNKLKKKKK